MLNVIISNDIMLNVIILNNVMLKVVAPKIQFYNFKFKEKRESFFSGSRTTRLIYFFKVLIMYRN
jgi:hypothetical protein